MITILNKKYNNQRSQLDYVFVVLLKLGIKKEDGNC